MATATTKGVPAPQVNGSTTLTEAVETDVKGVEETTAKATNTLVVWLRKLPLASLGLAAVVGDEAKVLMNKLYMNKLIERGERVQKDAKERMERVQARFR